MITTLDTDGKLQINRLDINSEKTRRMRVVGTLPTRPRPLHQPPLWLGCLALTRDTNTRRYLQPLISTER